MEIGEFRKDLLEEVRTKATVDGDGSCAAFVEIVANHLITAEVLPAFEPAFYAGTGRRNRKIRVDGYVMDDLDGTLNLVVADYTGSNEAAVLTRTEAEQVFEWPVRFIDETLNDGLRRRVEISTPPADLVDLLVSSQARIRKYRVIVVTDRPMSERIGSLEVKDFGGTPVECQIWDVARIYRVCVVDTGKESVEVDFEQYSPPGLPCLEASNPNADPYRCFLCVIPGSLLADIYDRHGSQLLEGNVRSFLSTKVAVNRKIRETILGAPKMFFAYNNGVSAIASGVEIVDTQDGKFVKHVEGFQIINGGQTTASLSNARFKDKAVITDIYVPMKLTEVSGPNEEIGEILQKISRSSNTQNRVSDADFFSTHPFHVRMEQIARRRYAPAVGGAQYDTHWFYERARGQYVQAQMRMTKSERDRFLVQNPRSQLVSKTDLAKVRNSWRCLPHIVSRGAQTNFTEFAEWVDEQWASSADRFNERFFQESIALLILFKRVERLVTSQPWYEKGYRANIVTYSIALLAHLIGKQYPNRTLDLLTIWPRQDVPEVVVNVMEILSRVVMEAITDPSRETVNVTQWCKREACWTRIKNLSVELDSAMQSVLIDVDEAKSGERSAKSDQRTISGIEAQVKVVKLGSEYWLQLRGFVARKGLASPEETIALNLACNIPAKLPNSYQCQRLLLLVRRAVSEGYLQ